MRRASLLLLLPLIVAGVLYALCAPLLEAVTRQRIDANLQRVDARLLDDGRLHVLLCGTAAALPDPDRAGPCTAVLAGGQFILIDAGPGSWRVLDGLNLPLSRLSSVLITHLHSDHIGELGEAIEQSWIAGRKQPLDVYGPPGIEDVLQGFAQVYAHDVGYRVAHHGETYMPGAAAPARAHPLAPPQGTQAQRVFSAGDLEVSVFAVDHAPVDHAYGYRIRYRGRTVVISGDTRPAESVRVNARNADLLLHEALSTRFTERAVQRAAALGQARTAKLAHDVGDYHTTPLQAAQLAQAAGVKELVLTHIFPPLPNALARHLFLEGTREVYSGKLLLGEDGMRFDLSPQE
ncbi:ribonuclease Z [Solimonas aquatica]|uniref:Ribonuclease Z n=1 Tax=Solimonas aquatica TaxID=489703 RepID=A0A1H9JV56_9GAMM|nr:MBL fold metallo-hydrolase [Solimonas aquatica]SEQ90644.1 ribonuclease Z [Solimonas aquatica]